MTELIDSGAPGAAERVAEVLSHGGVVVLPTDTVYGLAARAADPDAVARLFQCKGRTAEVPIAVLCATADQALDLAADVPDPARRLVDENWPGALTVVLPRRPGLGWALGRPHDTIGVRCPDHPLVRAVAAAVGPIATTSANRHGEPTPAEAGPAAASLAGAVDLVVDGGPLGGAASTVVDATGTPLQVLRQGTVEVGLG